MQYAWGGWASCNIQHAGEAVGAASTACSQRRPHLRVRTCELKLSFVTAGWWIHTFRNTTGMRLTQLQTRLSSEGLHYTKKLFFYLFHKTRANAQEHTQTTCTLWPGRQSLLGHRIWTFTSSVEHTHTRAHTRSLSLYWSALELHGNTSLWQHCNLGGMSTSNERQPTHKHTDRVTVNVRNLEFCWDQNQGFFPQHSQNTPKYTRTVIRGTLWGYNCWSWLQSGE